MVTQCKFFKRILFRALCVLVLTLAFTSCDTFRADPKPLIFETGPVVLMPLGGVIESFNIIIDDLGSQPIDEYGIVYAFDSIDIVNEPVITDKKVVFEEPAKVGGNSKNVNIGFPVGTICVSCRAYAKFKDGQVQYAKGQKWIF